ncbi:putative lipoprotein lpph [hydrocarbon metagenome]|uniref:Putative lipoprotein lpph n=1 Tax=hydrocarbon metagenome TaxID=938273 RepID=A0A0W8E909_9ZZZZ
MVRKLTGIVLIMVMLISLVGCSGADTGKKDAAAPPESSYKIGVVTPTLSASEDEFRGAQVVMGKYPDMITHIVLPDNFSAEQETAITQITSLGDDNNIKGVIICAGYSGILPAIQKLKEKRPDMVVITAPIWDDPDMMSDYIDLCLDTDWLERGVTIPTKAYSMGARTFIHYSFPTHMAKELLANRRDKMKETCEELGMTFVEVSTPDPQTGSGPSAMLQFLQEDIPRQIEKYGKDTCIFGTNCPMQDVIIAKALELKFIMAEQCCPTPTQGFPAAMGLEISSEDAGDFDKLNQLIADKAAEAGETGRLSTWPVPVGYFFPEFSVEIARGIIEGGIDKDNIDMEVLISTAQEVAGVEVNFNQLNDEIDNYYLIIMDSIIY